MPNKEEFYNWVRIAGLVSLIPFVLISGPIGGYILGDFLEKSFHTKIDLVLIFTLIGLVAGLFETFRIIRVMVKLGNKQK